MPAESKNPRQVLWREWRNTPDLPYAQQLYQLVAHWPVGWPFVICTGVLGGLFTGLAIGLAIGLPAINLHVLGNPSEWRFSWAELWPILCWSVACCTVAGFAIGLALRRGITWDQWLRWWAPRVHHEQLAGFLVLTAAIRGAVAAMFFNTLAWLVTLIAKSHGVVTAFQANAAFLALLGGIICLLSGLDFRLFTRLMFVLLAACAANPAPSFDSWTGFGLVFGAMVGVLVRLAGMSISNLVMRAVSGLVAGLILATMVSGLGREITPSHAAWQHAAVFLTALGVVLPLMIETTPLDALFAVESGFDSIPEAARPYCFWWRGRPGVTEVEDALTQFQTGPWPALMKNLEERKAHPVPADLLARGLEHRAWRERFLARHVCFAVGTEVIPYLVPLVSGSDPAAVADARWLIRNICASARARVGEFYKNALCNRCFARFAAHTVRLPRARDETYYGCRICHQNREFLQWDGPVVAALDRRMSGRFTMRGHNLCVNWFEAERAFDFDSVEITDATDTDIERFIIRLGNDANAPAPARLKRITCTVAQTDSLRPETLNLLKDTFGNVMVVRNLV